METLMKHNVVVFGSPKNQILQREKYDERYNFFKSVYVIIMNFTLQSIRFMFGMLNNTYS